MRWSLWQCWCAQRFVYPHGLRLSLLAWNNGWDYCRMWRKCKHWIVRFCNIDSLKTCIKHLSHWFGKSTNPCIQEWYFIEWMMASGTPSTRWNIGMKQSWNI
jgi:hypothetical protein